MKLYGLTACETCRKARKALESKGKTVTFQDVRDDPLSEAKLSHFLDAFGDALLNTRSTTWRNLSEDERQGQPLELLKAHPTLMKRPVIEDGNELTLGWTRDVQARLLG